MFHICMGVFMPKKGDFIQPLNDPDWIMRTIMNKKLALLSILPVAVLAVAVPALSNNTAALQLQAETPTPTIRSFTFNDFSNGEYLPNPSDGKQYWCLNPETGNNLGLYIYYANKVVSESASGITIQSGCSISNGVSSDAGLRRYKMGLISAVTVYYTGSDLEISLGSTVHTGVASGTKIEADYPRSSVSIRNGWPENITISSIVFEYKC